MKKILRVIFAILILLNTLVIFGFSSQDGKQSSGISKKVITVIANIINVEDKDSFIENGEPIIRKLAHFSIYTLLGIWSMGFISTFNINETKRLIGNGAWGIIYATTDEIHQSFVNGRDGNICDVLIDTLGVLFGTCIVLLILKIKKTLKKKILNLYNIKNWYKINIERLFKLYKYIK